MKMEVKLRPFTVPNFVLVEQKTVLRQDGMHEAPKFALADLTPEALDELCNTFRRGVFAKANKADPEWTRPKQAQP